MLFSILTITGGLIAASTLLIAKKPDAKQLFDKVAPYQGGLGIALLAFGVYHLVINVLPNIGGLIQMPLTAAIVFTGLALDIFIGFLLGYGLISSWTSKNEAAAEKSKATFAKLVRVQVPMGLAAIAVGTLNMIGF